MNEQTEPITSPGISWAINQINRRFEQALAKHVPPIELPDPAEEALKALEGLKR